jgi:hypothetical protein
MIVHSVTPSVASALLSALQAMPGQCQVAYVSTLMFALSRSVDSPLLIPGELLASALDQVLDLRRPGFALNQQVSLLKGCLKTPALELP